MARDFDLKRRDRLRAEYPLEVFILTAGVIRLTDGVKRLDLYKTKYFKPDEIKGSRKRGRIIDEEKLINKYFNMEIK